MSYIHPTAVIGPNVIIEEDVYIGPLCVIGFPGEYIGKDHLDGGVLIRSGTRFTKSVVIDSGIDRITIIGEHCYIMAGVYVAHDCIINGRVRICSGARIGGGVTLGYGVNIGMNASIHQKQQIAAGCMIGANAFVTKNLKTEPYKTYVGVPAHLLKDNDKHPNYTIYMQEYFNERASGDTGDGGL